MSDTAKIKLKSESVYFKNSRNVRFKLIFIENFTLLSLQITNTLYLFSDLHAKQHCLSYLSLNSIK